MILVMPVHAGDVDRAKRSAQTMAHLGRCGGHSIIIVHTPDAATQIPDIAALFKPLFESVTILGVDANRSVRPHCVNYLFEAAARWITNPRLSHSQDPWLWCESDAIPIAPGWLDFIEDEYLKSRAQFMGSMRNGIMSRCSVYPANLWAKSDLIHYLHRATKYWPEYMRWEMVPCVDSSSIWETPEPVMNVRRDGPNLVYGSSSVIPSNAMLVHGVKDESLRRLVLGEIELRQEPSAEDSSVVEPITQKLTTQPQPRQRRRAQEVEI